MNLRILDMIVESTALVVILAQPGISSAQAGFMLAFANTISMSLNDILLHMRDFEVKGVSLERTAEYRAIEGEKGQVIDHHDAGLQAGEVFFQNELWPTQGAIEVRSLQASYGSDLPNILHDVSFSAEGGQRIGIIGATGGGKSTLAKAFFSFVDITHGQIRIDGQGKPGLRLVLM